jgi:hypothetical protein
MKKILFFLLTTLSSISLFSQDRKTIEPSGNIVTKDVAVKAFDAIEASGLYELVLTEGGKEAVKIEADDNLINLFSVSNNGSKLLIEMPELKNHNINSKKKEDGKNLKWKVYVTYRKLKSLDVAVVGNVTAETPIKSDDLKIHSKSVGNINLGIATEKLNVENVGVGNITLKGTATDAIVKNAGVGEFDGEELIVQTMEIDNSGIGSADVNVDKNLKIKQSFLGKVRNKGNAKLNNGEGVVI